MRRVLGYGQTGLDDSTPKAGCVLGRPYLLCPQGPQGLSVELTRGPLALLGPHSGRGQHEVPHSAVSASTVQAGHEVLQHRPGLVQWPGRV